MADISKDEKKLLEKLIKETGIPIDFFNTVLDIERQRILTNQYSCKGDILELIEETAKSVIK